MKLLDRNIQRLFLLAAMVIGINACEPDDVAPDVTRDDYLGAWTGQSDGPINGPLGFQMTITASNSAPNEILMDNFDAVGVGRKVIAVVDGGNITIPLNYISGDSIIGSGRYKTDGTLSFSFTVSDGQSVDERTATATR